MCYIAVVIDVVTSKTAVIFKKEPALLPAKRQQKCIDTDKKPVVIKQENRLHCGNCFEICPKRAIRRKG